MTSAATGCRYHHGDLRNALLQAAEQVLVEKGAAGLSLREAAKAAGVSHAAPYRHFRDKAALMRAVAQAGFERLALAINAAADSKPHNPEQKLIEAGVAYVRLAMENPEITRLMFSGVIDPQDDKTYQVAAAAAYESLLGIIKEGMERGTFRQRVPQELALVAWTSMHGMAMLAAAGQLDIESGDELALDELVRSVASNVIYGISK
jgi:AcrR family transcriptional regulator